MEKNRNHVHGWILKRSRKFIPAILFLTAIGIAISYVSVEFAMASKDLLDCVTGKNDLTFNDCIVRIALYLCIQLVLEISYTLQEVRVCNKFKNRLQNDLFHTVLTRDYLEVTGIHSGEIMNSITSDIDVIYTNVIEIVPGTAVLLSGIIFGIIAMYSIDSSLTLICIALGPIVMAGSIIYGRKMKKLYKDCRASDGKIRSFMLESIQNILAIKAFCKEHFASRYAAVLQKQNYRLNMKRGIVSVIVNIIYFFSLTAAYYFAVAWCAYKISLGVMTVGAFAAIAQLVGQIQAPFKSLASVIPKYYSVCASAERIMDLEKLSSDPVTDTQDAVMVPQSIEAKNITFAYKDKKTMFRDCNFVIKSGQTVVIKGHSGIGKSTFMKLLLGVIKPDSGSIELKCKGKTYFPCADTRRMFAYVPQGNMILSGTVRENVSFFDSDIDEERLERALKDACIFDYVMSLDNGVDTLIGEGGSGLSEGQIQRLAVARAFYSDAPVILLDEATSALDEETESRILENIHNMKDKTCIIITHKPCAEAFGDKILAVKNMKLVEMSD